jgi:aminoglycoside/choline kinase family phosphotransferase
LISFVSKTSTDPRFKKRMDVSNTMDCRLDQLIRWASSQVLSLPLLRHDVFDKSPEERWGDNELVLEPVSGDASFRRYFRSQVMCNGEIRTFICVDAPPAQEDCHPFVAVAKGLLASGVTVPDVLAVDYEQGFMLLGDLGSTLFLDELPVLTQEVIAARYKEAMRQLLNVMACDLTVPMYTAEKLREEMGLFSHWFLNQYLNVRLDESVLDRVFDLLIVSALEQPQVFVHRDYHSRNLMVLPDHGLGVIDFQDAVIGPITYDLVSLLRDCYVAWPSTRVAAWVADYRQLLLQKHTLGSTVSRSQFMKWFDWMGAQRHLKAIGIFARLYHRDGKSGYLQDIPRTLRYLLDVCDHYQDVRPLASEIRKTVLPALFERNHQAPQWFQEHYRVDFPASPSSTVPIS